MIIYPDDESPSRVYSTMIRAITPRPIAWVSTLSENGISNLAPFSYFNGVCSRPAALSISPVNKPDGTRKDTVINIEANGQFVVNVVPYSLSKAMLETANEYDYEESEFEHVDVTCCESKLVRPPGVSESPIRFECEKMQIVPIGEGPLAANLVIGKILVMHIDDSVLDERQKIDPRLVDSIGRLGGQEYCRTSERFEIQR